MPYPGIFPFVRIVIIDFLDGKSNPKLNTIQKIAAALSVNVNAELTIQVDDWEQIDIELVKKMKQLNKTGKSIAIERVEELAEISRYTQKESNMPDKEE